MKGIRRILKEVISGAAIALVIVAIPYFVVSFYFYDLHLQFKFMTAEAHLRARQIQYEANLQAQELLSEKEIKSRMALLSLKKEWILHLSKAKDKGLREWICAYLKYRDAYKKAANTYKSDMRKARYDAAVIREEAKKETDKLIRYVKKHTSIFQMLIVGMANRELLFKGYNYDPLRGKVESRYYNEVGK